MKTLSKRELHILGKFATRLGNAVLVIRSSTTVFNIQLNWLAFTTSLKRCFFLFSFLFFSFCFLGESDSDQSIETKILFHVFHSSMCIHLSFKEMVVELHGWVSTPVQPVI